MIFQVHWQNAKPPHETEFVAQASTEELKPLGVDPEDWIHELVQRRKGECPEGWMPAVLSEGHSNWMGQRVDEQILKVMEAKCDTEAAK